MNTIRKDIRVLNKVKQWRSGNEVFNLVQCADVTPSQNTQNISDPESVNHQSGFVQSPNTNRDLFRNFEQLPRRNISCWREKKFGNPDTRHQIKEGRRRICQAAELSFRYISINSSRHSPRLNARYLLKSAEEVGYKNTKRPRKPLKKIN